MEPSFVNVPVRRSARDPTIVDGRWPIILPDSLLPALAAQAPQLVFGPDSASSWWQNFAREQPLHPFVQQPGVDFSRAVAVSLHGDEGSGQREVPTFVVTWMSSTNTCKNAWLNRFIIFVLPSRRCAMDGTRNRTLDALLGHVAESLGRLAAAGQGALVSVRGDWKWLVQSMKLTGWRPQCYDVYC